MTAPLASGWIEVLVLAFLAITAIIIARMRNLLAAVMLTGIYSFLGAGWMLLLDAPDVAFTEAAVGAGLATILMLATLSLTGRETRKPAHGVTVPLLVVTLTGAALVYGTLDMPRFGDPDAPVHQYPSPSFVERAPEEIAVPNVVTAVLASYRGYDTLGEVMVIFTAAIAVFVLLRGTVGRRPQGRSMSTQSILRVVAKLLVPYILLFGLYVQFHGDYGPGGGFQAGVIFGAGIILFGMVFGPDAAARAASPTWVELMVALGVLIYAGVGIAAMLAGGNFLDYSALDHHDPVHGQHLGILLIELGVGVTVAAVMISIVFCFAARGRSR